MYKICTNCVGATYSGWWHAKLKSKELDKRNHYTYFICTQHIRPVSINCEPRISVGFEPTTFWSPWWFCILCRLVQYHMPLHRVCITTLNWTIKERPTNYLPEFQFAIFAGDYLSIMKIKCGYGRKALTNACITPMLKVNRDCAYVYLAR